MCGFFGGPHFLCSGESPVKIVHSVTFCKGRYHSTAPLASKQPCKQFSSGLGFVKGIKVITMIEFVNVKKEFEDSGVVALENANFKIENGEFVFLVGSSGAGKTTITKLIMRETNVTEGEVYLDGIDVTKLPDKEIPYLRRKMGVVFQDFRLLEDRTVYENVEFAMRVVGASKREIRKRVPEVLSQVGLNYKAKMLPRQLSGGEQQRVALARALVNHPLILIADEPTGNLNPKTAMEIMDIFEEINRMGTTIIMATHAKEIVDIMKKRVIEVCDGNIVRDEVGGEYHENVQA